MASCVFHYELEFIHPFHDGNGRMGRLWQTLILSRWNPLFAWLPVESVVRDRQADYYAVLGRCDKVGNSTEFVEFLLEAILAALRELPKTVQVTVQVTEQVARLLRALGARESGAGDLMKALDLSHRPTFLVNYLDPALKAGLIERTYPDSPRSPRQKYRLTDAGKRVMVSPLPDGRTLDDVKRKG